MQFMVYPQHREGRCSYAAGQCLPTKTACAASGLCSLCLGLARTPSPLCEPPRTDAYPTVGSRLGSGQVPLGTLGYQALLWASRTPMFVHRGLIPTPPPQGQSMGLVASVSPNPALYGSHPLCVSRGAGQLGVEAPPQWAVPRDPQLCLGSLGRGLTHPLSMGPSEGD